MTELAEKQGDCASAILATASDLGCEQKEHLLADADFTCSSEGALATLLDKATFDAILQEVARRENEGSLHPCQSSPDKKISSCFHKCPLLMDLLLQADKLKERPEF
ncbi:MAG: hypothetical protein K2X81_25770 [Candidatus Obscuribacterales bacterium]|nr:hypothetical protein [Candidatus Obscuribacterales bacterium]